MQSIYASHLCYDGMVECSYLVGNGLGILTCVK
jgi:hypothetical protein